MNTLAAIVMFLPALWLAGADGDPAWAPRWCRAAGGSRPPCGPAERGAGRGATSLAPFHQQVLGDGAVHDGHAAGEVQGDEEQQDAEG